LSSHSCHSYYSIYVLLPSSYSSSSPAPAPTETYTLSLHDALPISSTYDNAVIAQGMLREERPEHKMRIHLLDSHTYSMVFGWYVCELARKLRNGAELRHVVREFETQMDKMEIVLGPYSLRQMKKSGRISAAAAFAGELLGLRPI